jgi:type IV pilus secretin PilQ/predicted competence protein
VQTGTAYDASGNIQLTSNQTSLGNEPPMPPASSVIRQTYGQEAFAPLPPANSGDSSPTAYLAHQDLVMVSQDPTAGATGTMATKVSSAVAPTYLAQASTSTSTNQPTTITATQDATTTTAPAADSTPNTSTTPSASAAASESQNTLPKEEGIQGSESKKEESLASQPSKTAEGEAASTSTATSTATSTEPQPPQPQQIKAPQVENVATSPTESSKEPEPTLPKEPEVQQGSSTTSPAATTTATTAPVQPGEIRTSQTIDGATVIDYWHIDNQPINKILEIISRRANMNMALTAGVKGNVTIDLRNTTMDDALQIIARLNGLTVHQEDGVIYVSTQKELREIEENGELPVRIYHLSYITAKDAKEMISGCTSGKGKVAVSPESKTGLTSNAQTLDQTGSTGSTSKVDAGGNTMAGGDILIVQDYEAVLKKIDKVIAQIDIRPAQVMIEAVLVQVELSKDMELGVNFAVLDGANSALGVMGNGALVNAGAGFTPSTVVTSAGKIASGMATDNYGLKFGWTGGSTTGLIKALEGCGKTEVLATPRLLVLNKQSADLQLGKNLGYYTTSVSQTSSTQTVSYLKIGTQLRIRPFICPNGLVRLEVHPERTTGALDASGIPQTQSAQVTSNVMVPDGFTLMIGGLIDDETVESKEGLPFLMRIPVLGNLFCHTVTTKTKKELVVVLTPHIWNPACPEGLNHLGTPETIGIERRVHPQPPFLPAPGEESLYEVIANPDCITPKPCLGTKSKCATEAKEKDKCGAPKDKSASPTKAPTTATQPTAATKATQPTVATPSSTATPSTTSLNATPTPMNLQVKLADDSIAPMQ